MRLAFASSNKLKPQLENEIPVSVIICAKNEEDNLKINLPEILEQDYSNFEVVVIDDNSTDETYYVLKAMQQKHKHLEIVRLSENVNFFKGKKFPLSIGIRSAKHPYLLLTDADTRPLSNQWIKSMSAGFTNNKKIVLGYGKYDSKSGFLNKIIRFETMYTALQYFSFALAKIPYMGVGRNLAYEKSLFNDQKGFSQHYNVMSGDDDLFINACATKKNTSVVIHQDSFTVSEPHITLGKWWKQKRRHLTTGTFYKTKHKLLLSLYPTAYVLFFLSFSFAIQDKNNFYILFSLLLLKVILSMVVYKKVTEKFFEKKLFIFSLFFEAFLILFYGIIFLTNMFSKQGKWK